MRRPCDLAIHIVIALTLLSVIAMLAYARLDDRIAHLEHQVQVLESRQP